MRVAATDTALSTMVRLGLLLPAVMWSGLCFGGSPVTGQAADRAAPGNEPAISGEWVTCRADFPRDRIRLSLHPEGYGFVTNHEGDRAPLIFAVQGDELHVVVKEENFFVESELVVSGDRARLAFKRDDRVEDDGFLVRPEAFASSACDSD